MLRCLIAEYPTGAAAKLGLEVLEHGEFTLENVSVVSNASDPAAEHLRHLHERREHFHSSLSAPEGRRTSLGMLIGGSVAAPIAAGTLVGPFIIAGPLVGMALGAAIGSMLGGMERWGVAHDVSSDYEQRVQSGSVLIIVHDVEDQRLQEAHRLLQETDPTSLDSFEVDEGPLPANDVSAG